MTISVKDISFSYNGQKLLDKVNLEIRPSEIHCVVGKNGAGKSTMLKILTGDLKPQNGKVFINHNDLNEFSIQAQALIRGVMLQETRVEAPFTVREVCALGRSPHHGGLETNQDERTVKNSLRLVDNWKLKDKSIQKISGGEKQRTHLARVLSQIWTSSGFESKYLLLDEPISSLDIQHQIQVLRILKILSKRGLGIFLILHDLNLASAFADRITILQNGKIFQTGKPKDVLTAETLKETFGIEVKVFYDSELDQVLIHPINQTKEKRNGKEKNFSSRA
jgi:iron complex transport system ATP-binding protein